MSLHKGEPRTLHNTISQKSLSDSINVVLPPSNRRSSTQAITTPWVSSSPEVLTCGSSPGLKRTTDHRHGDPEQGRSRNSSLLWVHDKGCLTATLTSTRIMGGLVKISYPPKSVSLSPTIWHTAKQLTHPSIQSADPCVRRLIMPFSMKDIQESWTPRTHLDELPGSCHRSQSWTSSLLVLHQC